MNPTTYQTPGALELDVRIPSGTVTVIASVRATTMVTITGEHAPDEVSVHFDAKGSGHQLSISQQKRGLFGWKGRALKVRVEVPEHTAVTIDGGSTDLHCQGTVDSVRFDSGSGDAVVEHVSQDIDARVASGDLQAEQVGGELTFHSASGDLAAAAVGGQITARTASGDVALGVVSQRVDVTTVSGDISIQRLDSGGSTKLQAVSGDILVGVPAGASVYLDLSAVSGSTRSDLRVSDSPTTDSDTTETSEIRAATVSGDIRVQHSRS